VGQNVGLFARLNVNNPTLIGIPFVYINTSNGDVTTPAGTAVGAISITGGIWIIVLQVVGTAATYSITNVTTLIQLVLGVFVLVCKHLALLMLITSNGRILTQHRLLLDQL
jgi:hypothetical protein